MSSNGEANKRNTRSSTSKPVVKKLRSYTADVIVQVGKDKDMKEFTVDGYCLSRASPEYFDTMLSSNMREGVTKTISFPEMESSVWEDFTSLLTMI